MPDKKTIVFDLDGVLFNSVGLMSEITREEFPGITDEQILDLHRGNIHEEKRTTSLKRREATEEWWKERWQRYAREKALLPMYPGMRDLVIKLAKGFNLAINTSALDANTLPLLEQAGIKECFAIVGTKQLHQSKVEKFKIIADKFGQKPKELLFITDTIGDLREADLAGVPTILVTWGLHSRSYLESEPHPNVVATVDNVRELKDCINKIKKSN
jgi:HAD superfamily hydrolase (TIGR01509 family)